MWDLLVGKGDSGEPSIETAVRELLRSLFAAHEWTDEPESREPCEHAQGHRVDAVPEAFVDMGAVPWRDISATDFRVSPDS